MIPALQWLSKIQKDTPLISTIIKKLTKATEELQCVSKMSHENQLS